MGYYIQVPEHIRKAEQIISLYGAQSVRRPAHFNEVPPDKALICVVANPQFEAAAVCYDEEEFKSFSRIEDYRPRTWLLMDKKKAYELAHVPTPEEQHDP